MPYQGGGAEIEFDFTRHELIITTNGAARRMLLVPRKVADFYAEYSASSSCRTPRPARL